jgi:hypothetical protein
VIGGGLWVSTNREYNRIYNRTLYNLILIGYYIIGNLLHAGSGEGPVAHWGLFLVGQAQQQAPLAPLRVAADLHIPAQSRIGDKWLLDRVVYNMYSV